MKDRGIGIWECCWYFEKIWIKLQVLIKLDTSKFYVFWRIFFHCFWTTIYWPDHRRYFALLQILQMCKLPITNICNAALEVLRLVLLGLGCCHCQVIKHMLMDVLAWYNIWANWPSHSVLCWSSYILPFLASSLAMSVVSRIAILQLCLS